ncbi:diaminopimelate decarboxylase [Balneolaceae bacterium ANBcel3]|nr:diaminopimelate decarboxylase [Balneolaceae bacterium ANBcel3]
MQDKPSISALRPKLLEVAQEYGTPTYLYNEPSIRHRCRKLKNLFSDTGVSVQWLYAVKANDNPHIVRMIREEGFGFDTVSFEEVLVCLKTGTQPGQVFYTENNMTDTEMKAAAENGVVINFGSLGRFQSFCEAYPGSECSIRVKPDIGDGHHAKVDTGNKDSKFGIRLDRIPEILHIAHKNNVAVTGVHAHIGSGITKPENLLHEVEVLLDIARSFKDLKTINFGGGIPVPYKPDEKEFDMENFARLAAEKLKKFLEVKPDITFLFEPGRWLVAHAGVLLTQVNTVKDQGSKIFVGTDTGFNHLIRPALYDAYHDIVNLSSESEKTNVYEIAGNICESGDILGHSRTLPVTHPGDYLAIMDAGAYGMTMASSYNRRSLPAEVLLDEKGGHKMIRKRKSAMETVDEFLKETGFQAE